LLRGSFPLRDGAGHRPRHARPAGVGRLVERGHEVHWYTGHRFADRVEAAGARYVPMKAARDFNDLDISGEFPGRSGLSELRMLKFDLKHVFGDPAPGQVADLREHLERFSADVVVADTAMIGAHMLDELGGPPCAGFGVTALTMSSRDTAPFGLGLLPRASALGRIRNRALNWMVAGVLFRDVADHFDEIRKGLGLPRSGGNVFDAATSRWLYLQATVPSFEYPRADLPPQVHFIGPFLPSPRTAPFTPSDWWHRLDTGQPVVHVTQGTSATDPAHLIRPTLAGLADEDVLVVATTGGRPPEDVGPAPANAIVDRFVPHSQLLPRVTAMVTNGGYGGTQIALAHGIPLVVAGGSEDKPEIANRVAWAGAGINLRTRSPKPARIRAAVRAVLDEPGYRRAAERLRDDMARYDAVATAADLLERLAATGRPVLRDKPAPREDESHTRPDGTLDR
jgi:MGT family glycosyltransferase